MSIITRYAEIDVWSVNRDGALLGMVHYRPTVLLDAQQTKRSILFYKTDILSRLQVNGVKVDDLAIDSFAFDLVNSIPEPDREPAHYKDYVVDARLLIDN